MKKVLLTSLIATMATFASNAAVSPYVSAHLGYTRASILTSDDRDNFLIGDWMDSKFAFDVSGAFGVKYDLSKSFALRGELEYDYLEKFKNTELDDTIWMRSHTLISKQCLHLHRISVPVQDISLII